MAGDVLPLPRCLFWQAGCKANARSVHGIVQDIPIPIPCLVGILPGFWNAGTIQLDSSEWPLDTFALLKGSLQYTSISKGSKIASGLYHFKLVLGHEFLKLFFKKKIWDMN